LVRVYRGTSNADQIYYYYAKSLIGQNDHLTPVQYLKLLIKERPSSEHVEEAQFLIGYCSYIMSPNPRLDQAVTHEAIDALQLYINLFPFGKHVDEANRIIDELQNKLVYKSYLSSKLYYDFRNYKASVVALTNALKEYPDSQYREELMYMLLKSKYLLAMRSIEDKQMERLSDALDEYFAFVDELPESSHKREEDSFYETTAKMLNYKESTNINLN
jgi:outer membrane protein assembly factor BamD